MSIEFSPAFDSGHSSLPRKTARRTSPRRLAANRRNARKSTGPRTAAGKRRSSRNALKHGVCSLYALLEGECAATYATFVHEIEEELQPRTTLQRCLLPHIANLLWRIDRLPQAQAEVFTQELDKCGRGRARGRALTSAQVLAQRFSDAPAENGFLLMGRYERGLHNELHRLLSRYDQLKKLRPTMPIDETEAMIAELRRGEAVDAYAADCARRFNAEAEAARAAVPAQLPDLEANRTQSKPTQTPRGEAEPRKSVFLAPAPATKQSHARPDAAAPPPGPRAESAENVTTPPPSATHIV